MNRCQLNEEKQNGFNASKTLETGRYGGDAVCVMHCLCHAVTSMYSVSPRFSQGVHWGEPRFLGSLLLGERTWERGCTVGT